MTHHENRPISLTSMLVSMHESEGTHFKCPFYIGLVPRTSWGRPYDSTPPSLSLRARCDHFCPQFPLISPRNGSLQLFDRDASIVYTHTYCKQTLHHGKLLSALAGSLLGSSRPGLASRRPWRDPRVTRSSAGCSRAPYMGDLEVWFNHHENCPIYLTSLLV